MYPELKVCEFSCDWNEGRKEEQEEGRVKEKVKKRVGGRGTKAKSARCACRAEKEDLGW